MAMQIELAKTNDLPAVVEFFTKNLGEDCHFYNFNQGELYLVAKSADRIIGAGVVYRNELHNLLPKIVIAVEPHLRRKGLGTKIHSELIKRTQGAKELGFDGACSESNQAAVGFMASFGYNPYLDCYTLTWELTSTCEYQWGLDVELLSKNLANDEDHGLIKSFLIRRYSELHDWNPVTLPPEDPVWSEVIFENVDLELSAVVTHNDTILGVTTGFSSEDTLHVIWPIVKEGSLDDQIVILKMLLGFQFKMALEKNLKKATIEVDSNYKALATMMNWLPIVNKHTWRRFRL